MSLNVACPSCQTRYNLPEKFAGKKVKCKTCGKPFAATVGAAKAKSTIPAKVARQQQADPAELSKMGIGAIRPQQDPFGAEPHLGPDPLRNHVVQDPGFGGASGMPGQMTLEEEEKSDDDPDFAAVTANPYIKPLPSPRTVADSKSNDNKRKRLVNATMGKRFFGYILDGISLNILAAAGFGIGAVAGNISPILTVIICGLTLLFLLCYFIIFEAIWGRTIGKFLLGTKVVGTDGSKVTFMQVVGRTFCRLIPFEPFSILMCDDSSRPLFWHDTIPQTRVIEL